ncbi:hypothetical protein PR001_g27044 [Phytophthora rubi]|uniref:Uncharacterized protein n=1 Tax=Phytophthora rubi TaxID=129364 RepID=A0A6A3HQL2_9STRA|nr:hypothetical protein PR002_g27163 [Phytophthora rubi]KAE8970965.1 hypothetical protein PR001_g27044 [Phytophthora rubi]
MISQAFLSCHDDGPALGIHRTTLLMCGLWLWLTEVACSGDGDGHLALRRSSSSCDAVA